MASIHRHPRSPFYWAFFYLPDGRRTSRSTGASDRREAQRIAGKFEDAAREAKSGRFTEARARKTIADIFELANQQDLPSASQFHAKNHPHGVAICREAKPYRVQ